MERVVPGKDLGRQAIFDPLRGFCPRQEIVALRQPIQRVVTSQSSKHLLFVSATTGFHTYYKRLELALASPRIWATSQQRHEEALSVGNFHPQLAHIVLLSPENEELDKGGIHGSLSHLSRHFLSASHPW